MKTAFPPGHFYSPIVDPIELASRRRAIWKTEDELIGIDLAPESHTNILRDVFPKFINDFDYPATLPETDELHSFFINNSQFSWLDARLLFVLLREWRPKRVIEVGAGFSSLLMADVNCRFLDKSCEIVCVDPFPRTFLKRGVRGISRLIETRVQEVAIEEFSRLTAGDVLFIDSSHVAKTGSDVNYLLFEVLPRLADGVHIHIHDIFFPNEYPSDWVLGENRSWNEQYLVRAFLMYSTAFRVTFGSSIAFTRHFNALAAALRQPNGDVWGGASLWIAKVGGQIA